MSQLIYTFHTIIGFLSLTLHEQLFFFTLVLLFLMKTSFRDLDECRCYKVPALSFDVATFCDAETFCGAMTLLETGTLFVAAVLIFSWTLLHCIWSFSLVWSPLMCFSSIFLSQSLSKGILCPLTSLKSIGSV